VELSRTTCSLKKGEELQETERGQVDVNSVHIKAMLRFCIVLALAVPAFADTQDHFTKKRLAQEEQGVKEATVAARVVAAKDASSFDREMSKLNSALFPSEKKAAWHHQSPEDISKHWKEVSANAMGKGGDELSRKAAFAASPKAHPAAGKAAVKRETAVEQHEQLSAVEQAAAEIEHIKAITEAAFPTMMKADKTNEKDKISAAQLLAGISLLGFFVCMCTNVRMYACLLGCIYMQGEN